MKTERRHELQTNALADWLGDKIKSVQPYAKTIVGVAILALVSVVAVRYVQGQRSKASAEGWKTLFTAQASRDVEQLEKVGTDHPNEIFGQMALLAAADDHMRQGSRSLHSDRAEANRLLSRALTAYQNVAEKPGNEMLEQRARLGMAQCYESLNNVEGAEKEYTTIQEKWPDSSLGKITASRIAFLNKPSTREFLDWFEDQTPPERPSGLDSSFPGLDNTFGTGSDLGLPSLDDLGDPGDDSTSDPLSPPSDDDLADPGSSRPDDPLASPNLDDLSEPVVPDPSTSEGAGNLQDTSAEEPQQESDGTATSLGDDPIPDNSSESGDNTAAEPTTPEPSEESESP